MRITEKSSHYRRLEQQDVDTLVKWINQEDQQWHCAFKKPCRK